MTELFFVCFVVVVCGEMVQDIVTFMFIAEMTSHDQFFFGVSLIWTRFFFSTGGFHTRCLTGEVAGECSKPEIKERENWLGNDYQSV